MRGSLIILLLGLLAGPCWAADVVNGAAAAGGGGIDPGNFLNLNAQQTNCIVAAGSTVSNCAIGAVILVPSAFAPTNAQNLDGAVVIGQTRPEYRFVRGGVFIGRDNAAIGQDGAGNKVDSVVIGADNTIGVFPAWVYPCVVIGQRNYNAGHTAVVIGYEARNDSFAPAVVLGYARSSGNNNVSIQMSGGITCGVSGDYNTALGQSANILGGSYNFWHSVYYSPLGAGSDGNIGVGYPQIGVNSDFNIAQGYETTIGAGITNAAALLRAAACRESGGVAFGAWSSIPAGATNAVALGFGVTNPVPDSTAIKGNTLIFENGCMLSNNGVNLFFRNGTGGVWQTSL